MGNLYVNGLQVDVTSASFNFFKLLKVLRKELEFHDRVATLPLQSDFIGIVGNGITRIVASEASGAIVLNFPCHNCFTRQQLMSFLGASSCFCVTPYLPPPPTCCLLPLPLYGRSASTSRAHHRTEGRSRGPSD